MAAGVAARLHAATPPTPSSSLPQSCHPHPSPLSCSVPYVFVTRPSTPPLQAHVGSFIFCIIPAVHSFFYPMGRKTLQSRPTYDDSPAPSTGYEMHPLQDPFPYLSLPLAAPATRPFLPMGGPACCKSRLSASSLWRFIIHPAVPVVPVCCQPPPHSWRH